MTAAQKNAFRKLQDTLSVVTKEIDNCFERAKSNGEKGKRIWDKYSNFKSFLDAIESDAIKAVSKDLGLSESTIKERWRILTLPSPVYDALEEGSITMSKAKPITATAWDFEDEKDIEIIGKIVDSIKEGFTVEQIKEMVKKESVNVWHSKDIVMERLAKQNHITEKTLC